jgi:hypothetical protein
MSVRGLLGAISAHGHAAPAARPAARMVCEKQGAGRSLARLYVCEVFRTNELRQGFTDGKKKRLRRTPTPHGF